MSGEEGRPTAFVSYSWDDEEHKSWVRSFAAKLREDGVDVLLDQWQVQPGDRLPAFMEDAIRENDFVIVVCTPHYKDRSDARRGGVGYEGDIMTGELYSKRDERKFIPVLRRGDESAAIPSWLLGKYYVDARRGADQERSYEDLLNTLLGRREAPPPLGSPRVWARQGAISSVAHEGAFEPIRVLGVIADEVTQSPNNGTRGSALYRIPLRLSRRPPAEWAELFERTWDHPPRFTTMHRPGILSVQGDRIVLDGTTVEELERYHRDTLLLVLEKVNSEIADRQAAKRSRAEVELQRCAEHRGRVADVAGRLDFEGNRAASSDWSEAGSAESANALWSIERTAAKVASRGRDGTGYAWKLRRGDRTHVVVVWIGGSAMASAESALPAEVGQAKRTKGRSVVQRLLSLEDPPAEVVVTNEGVRRA